VNKSLPQVDANDSKIESRFAVFAFIRGPKFLTKVLSRWFRDFTDYPFGRFNNLSSPIQANTSR